ncbi:MAG TPA: hypothetical protein VMW75_19665, partial [Thermoanaerobaculia bacterium]|nr:hypothetical protein [Thermoanaerobaculia bacterium]
AAWCGTVTGGGRLLIGNNRYAHDSAANWVVPQGCTVASSGPVAGDPATNPVNWASTTGGAILINPAYTISLGGALDGVLVAPYGMGPAASGQAYYQQVLSFTGTGVTQTADRAALLHSAIVGFALALTNNDGAGHARMIMDDVLIDDTAGMLFNASNDVAHISKVHAWPWTGGSINNIPYDAEAVSGVANNGSGLIRLTIASAADYATGNVVEVQGVGGAVGADCDKCTITVIDGTHIDLQGSAFAGATPSCNWAGTENVIACASVSQVTPGGAVSGTNITTGSTVLAVDPINKKVWLSKYTQGPEPGGVTVTFALGTYTSGGQVVLNGMRRSGAFLEVENSTQNDFHDLFEYNYAIGYYAHTGALWTFLHDASCDGLIVAAGGVTTDRCYLLDSTALETEIIGGEAGGSTIALDEETTGNNLANDMEGVNIRGGGLANLAIILNGVTGSTGDYMKLGGISTPASAANPTFIGPYPGQNFVTDNFGAAPGLYLMYPNGAATAGATVPYSQFGGTWTPSVLLGGAASSGMTFSTSPVGHFSIDPFGTLTAEFGFILSAVGSGTGNLTIDGLPLTCISGQDNLGTQTVTLGGAASLTSTPWSSAAGGSNHVGVFDLSGAGTGGQSLTNANLTATTNLSGSLQCRTR